MSLRGTRGECEVSLEAEKACVNVYYTSGELTWGDTLSTGDVSEVEVLWSPEVSAICQRDPGQHMGVLLGKLHTKYNY